MVRENTPTWSRKDDCFKIPVLEINPKEGLYPTTPQYDAGLITDPFVCVPTERGAMYAATAAAEPLDEPPGVLE